MTLDDIPARAVQRRSLLRGSLALGVLAAGSPLLAA